MSPAAPDGAAAEGWLEATTRWGQVNFNEQDPAGTITAISEALVHALTALSDVEWVTKPAT